MSVSDGILSYRTGAELDAQLLWCDRRGKPLGPIGPPGYYYHFVSLSPDQQRLVVARLDSKIGTSDIRLFELSGGSSRRFTFDPAHEQHACWSPDGTRIVFSSNRLGTDDIYQKVSCKPFRHQEGSGRSRPMAA